MSKVRYIIVERTSDGVLYLTNGQTPSGNIWNVKKDDCLEISSRDNFECLLWLERNETSCEFPVEGEHPVVSQGEPPVTDRLYINVGGTAGDNGKVSRTIKSLPNCPPDKTYCFHLGVSKPDSQVPTCQQGGDGKAGALNVSTG